MTNIYELIVNELHKISSKRVVFGFEEDYTMKDNTLVDGKYYVMLTQFNSETISLNHRKQKEREIKITYFKSNDTKTNSLKEIVKVEEVIDSLIQSEALRERILNADYEFDLELIKLSDTDLTGVIHITITLKIKER